MKNDVTAAMATVTTGWLGRQVRSRARGNGDPAEQGCGPGVGHDLRDQSGDDKKPAGSGGCWPETSPCSQPASRSAVPVSPASPGPSRIAPAINHVNTQMMD